MRFFFPNRGTSSDSENESQDEFEEEQEDNENEAENNNDLKVDWSTVSITKPTPNNDRLTNSIFFTDHFSGNILTDNSKFDELYKKYFVFREPSFTKITNEDQIKQVKFILKYFPILFFN